MRRLLLIVVLIEALSCSARAQWQIQESHTTADLRGVHSIGSGVAWASGTNGTVLRTIDGGDHWQLCATPTGAEGLDFRGIQAFDANTAIVMSSGKGDLSRVYKTIDACHSWKLVFTNPDKDGFWDAYRLEPERTADSGVLFGDPVHNRFPVWVIRREESAFQIVPLKHRPGARKGESAFAASNSSLFVENVFFCFWIATGGTSGSRIIRRINHDFDSFGFDTFPSTSVPIGHRTMSSGIFGLSFRPNSRSHAHETAFLVGIAVGG